MAFQRPAADFSNDQDHGCCLIFKSLFKKQNTAAQRTPATPLPFLATFATNEDKPVQAEENTGPSTRLDDLQVGILPKEIPALSKDEEFSQTPLEAIAKFRNARDHLETVISKPNAKSPIELSLLDLSDIGNLPQMAQDIDLAISEFIKERESKKGKAIARGWIHKISFAGQRIVGTAESIASVSPIDVKSC